MTQTAVRSEGLDTRPRQSAWRLEASDRWNRKDQTLRFVFTSGAVAVAFVLAGLGGPFAGPILTPLRRLTGIPCPLCGMTTSFTHMAAGEFGDAFAASPAGPLLFVLFAVAAVAYAVLLIRRQRVVIPDFGRLVWLGALPVGAVWVYQLFHIGPL